MSIPWLNPLHNTLSQAFSQGKLHHAILLCGKRGVGKAVLAHNIVNALLCEAPNGLYACQRCKACLLQNAGNHPDRMLLSSENGIGVDEVREIGDFVVHSAQQGGRKAVIVEDAQQLTVSAANALLKTLEEPTKNRYLLLTCTDVSLLPATISSRCFKVNVDVTREQGETWLQENVRKYCSDSWHHLFASQPLLVSTWLEEGIDPDVKSLYDWAFGNVSTWPLAEMQRMLSKKADLKDAFCLFLLHRIKRQVEKSFDFSTSSEQTYEMSRFAEKLKTISGTNLALSLSLLQNVFNKPLN
ncbi:DNA polymerase III delta prime subunit [Pseudoalteromonas luteoviolacea B = ATCC 29581]|nr:DNA polymerase III delta prime subunit [Pseudoalteromonas luteoviolacea B = ATCC 29581]